MENQNDVRAYEFSDGEGHVMTVVHIRPNDISYLDRKKTASDRIAAIGHLFDAAGEIEDDAQRSYAWQIVENAYVEHYNWLFDTTDLTELFKVRRPFSVDANGGIFCIEVAKQLSAIFEQEIERNQSGAK